MIIALPDDGRGLLYHVIDLNGQTVHAYRDLDAALRSMEGDQRIAIETSGIRNRWLTGRPTPDHDLVAGDRPASVCAVVHVPGEYSIELRQHANKRFAVKYGADIKTGLGYAAGAARFGEAIFHALACAGRLDNNGPD